MSFFWSKNGSFFCQKKGSKKVIKKCHFLDPFFSKKSATFLTKTGPNFDLFSGPPEPQKSENLSKFREILAENPKKSLFPPQKVTFLGGFPEAVLAAFPVETCRQNPSKTPSGGTFYPYPCSGSPKLLRKSWLKMQVFRLFIKKMTFFGVFGQKRGFGGRKRVFGGFPPTPPPGGGFGGFTPSKSRLLF